MNTLGLRNLGFLGLSRGGITATGGSETTLDGYRIHTFTSLGTFSVTSVSPDATIEALVVAGGGGGGSARGGGGGGELRSSCSSESSAAS